MIKNKTDINILNKKRLLKYSLAFSGFLDMSLMIRVCNPKSPIIENKPTKEIMKLS